MIIVVLLNHNYVRRANEMVSKAVQEDPVSFVLSVESVDDVEVESDVAVLVVVELVVLVGLVKLEF